MKVMTIVAFVECPLKELWPIILCSIYTYIKLNTHTHLKIKKSSVQYMTLFTEKVMGFARNEKVV